MSIYGYAFSLFVIFNVIGNIPLFLSLLNPYDARKQRQIIFREMGIAFLILLIFGFFGDDILRGLGVSQSAVGIAGGALLFIISLTMVFENHKRGKDPEHEPFIVPMAIPVMAGPGSIAAIMVYSHQLSNSLTIIPIIFLAWVPSLIIVLLASSLKKLLGTRGLVAFERLGGLIISLMSVEMIITGILKLIETH
jgi:multiple antibiotic resistance protein